jgi:hypothetical protein
MQIKAEGVIRGPHAHGMDFTFLLMDQVHGGQKLHTCTLIFVVM